MNIKDWIVLADRQQLSEEIIGVKNNVQYFLEYNEISREFRLKEKFHNSGKDTIQDLNRNEAMKWYDKLPKKINPFPK